MYSIRKVAENSGRFEMTYLPDYDDDDDDDDDGYDDDDNSLGEMNSITKEDIELTLDSSAEDNLEQDTENTYSCLLTNSPPAERQRVRFPMRSLNFSIDLILPAAL
jgi:hypothetical protein